MSKLVLVAVGGNALIRAGQKVEVEVPALPDRGPFPGKLIYIAALVNPETRTVLQVTIENAADADRTFSILMGDEVEPRREFIEKNAKYVRNLDV